MVKVGSKVRSKTNPSLIGTVVEIIDLRNVIIEIFATKSVKQKLLINLDFWEEIGVEAPRLTEHTETSYRLKDCPKDCIRICNGCEVLKRAIERLGELEDVEHGILKKSRDFGK